MAHGGACAQPVNSIPEKERQAKNRRLFKNSYCRNYLDYVCVDESGKLLRPNFVTEHFGWVIRKYGLRKIRFHDLRHPNVKPKTQTFSSFLIFFKAALYDPA